MFPKSGFVCQKMDFDHLNLHSQRAAVYRLYFFSYSLVKLHVFYRFFIESNVTRLFLLFTSSKIIYGAIIFGSSG